MIGQMTPITWLAVAIAIVAIFALGAGGSWMITGRKDRQRGVLMIICALVILGNVLLWTLPA